MKKSWEQIHQELSEPFSHEDVEWKIQTVSKDKSRGLAVAYVTARAIQNRLDAVVGAQNWKPVFRQWHTVTDRDGNPIPSYEGEPTPVKIIGDIDAFTKEVWENLNEANKVSLFTRFIDIATGETQTRIVNKNK